MLKRKLMGVLMATVVVGAFGAAGASSASAVFVLSAQECVGGTNVALCYELLGGKFELTGTQAELVTGGKIVFTIKTTPEQKIECEKSKGHGTITQTEPLTAGKKTTLKGFLNYEGCKLITEPKAKCITQVNDETKELEGVLETESTLALKPATGTVFIEIEYTSVPGQTCPATFIGKHSVTGTQTVEILNPGVAEKTKKGKAIGHTLKFFSAEAELTQELTMAFENEAGGEKLEDEVYASKVA
jgi:hypothetical protein